MPIYEYKCKKCNNSFEKLVSISSETSICCPKCNSIETKKLFSTFGFKSAGKSSGSACGSCTSSNCSSCKM